MPTKGFLGYAVLAAIILSCNSKDERTGPIVPIDSSKWQVDTSLAEYDSLLNGILSNSGATISIDSTDYIIIPLSAPLFKREGKSVKTYYESGSYKDESTYWNLVFYNSNTRESHVLDTSRMLIHEINVNNLENFGKYADQLILYSIRTKDFNGDGSLQYDDPTYLYISDNSGRVLTRISPENASVIGWEFPQKGNYLVMTIRYDLNKDAVFDYKDPTSLIRIDMVSPYTNEALLKPAFENEIRRLFKKYYTEQVDSPE